MFHQKTLHQKCDAWVGALLWWSCQSPVAHSHGLLKHLNSFCGEMFKFNAKFDADLLVYLLILNAMATQYTCSLNGVYHPHWLVHWSHHCSGMHIPVHSSWLPGYIDVLQTVLISTMAGLFPDRPGMCIPHKNGDFACFVHHCILISQKNASPILGAA